MMYPTKKLIKNTWLYKRFMLIYLLPLMLVFGGIPWQRVYADSIPVKTGSLPDVQIPSVTITDYPDSYLEVDNGVKVYQFGYDGNNTIISEDRTLTILDGEHFDLSMGGNSFNLSTVDVSYTQTKPDQQNRQDTFINETYKDDSGLSYTVTYKLSYGTPPTVECKINSNSTDDYQANWNFNEYGNPIDSPDSNKLLFDNGIKIDWTDVSKSLGDIATPTIQVSQKRIGKIGQITTTQSTSINFDVGQIQQGKSLTIDPGLGDADPYWVLGGGVTANWSDAAGHWASTSGGTPSSGNLPGSGSNVNFDANSFLVSTGTVTVDATAYCLNMDWTGVTNTPTLDLDTSLYKNIYVYGNLTLGAVYLGGSRGRNNIYIEGNSNFISSLATGSFYLVPDTGGTLNFLDDVTTCPLSLEPIGSSVVNTNNHALNLSVFYADNNAIINLGSSNITVGSYGWYIVSDGVTFNAGTSNITINSDITTVFTGGSKTYNNVTFTNNPTITGSNTFSTLSLASGTTQTITFTDGTTQTASTFNLSGSSGHVHTLQGSSTGGWNITKSGGGTVTMDYVAVTYSTANPDNTFYDYTHGTDNGHNTHWYFTAPLVVNHGLGIITKLFLALI